MDFLQWWFDKHYILATIFTPGFSFLWAICYDLVARALWSFIVILIYLFLHLTSRR
jgi:hypothetical protein